jgi:hypothetical protein
VRVALIQGAQDLVRIVVRQMPIIPAPGKAR